MGVLIKVLDMALGPVLIFACVAMIPVIGLALSYHVAFGQNLKPYSSSFMSLNTLAFNVLRSNRKLHLQQGKIFTKRAVKYAQKIIVNIIIGTSICALNAAA